MLENSLLLIFLRASPLRKILGQSLHRLTSFEGKFWILFEEAHFDLQGIKSLGCEGVFPTTSERNYNSIG